jgi:hypothetical protein
MRIAVQDANVFIDLELAGLRSYANSYSKIVTCPNLPATNDSPAGEISEFLCLI